MDWWQEVDSNWVDLLGCIERFHPSIARQYEDMWNHPITAPNVEQACGVVRDKIASEQKGNVVAEAITAKEQRDTQKLHSIFNQTWFGAPESRSVFSVPGFGLLCDLCSEYPDEEERYYEEEFE